MFVIPLRLYIVPPDSLTGRYDFDFYLQAHAGLQGTVKATHYTVVYDESKLQADEIQQGTHSASYLYARATKAVSLIPPAYYADLACERGRCYLNNFLVDLDGKTSVSGRSKADTEQEEQMVFQAAKNAWGNGVCFCGVFSCLAFVLIVFSCSCIRISERACFIFEGWALLVDEIFVVLLVVLSDVL